MRMGACTSQPRVTVWYKEKMGLEIRLLEMPPSNNVTALITVNEVGKPPRADPHAASPKHTHDQKNQGHRVAKRLPCTAEDAKDP